MLPRRRHLCATALLLAAISIAIPLSRGIADEPIRLRVLSYNIHHAAGVDRKLDLDRIAGVIKSVDPDLAAIQEVDQNVARTGNVDQPAQLAKLTKLHVAFGGNIQLQDGRYGNLVLSRYPIVEQKNHRLPNVDQGEQRGVLATRVKIPGLAEPLLFMATHFDHRPNDEERVQSAKAVNGLPASADELALLAGDLNDVLGSRALKELAKSWTSTSTKPLPTVPVGQPKRQIDFILFRPKSSWKVVEVRVLDEAVASDHRAIFAVLELTSSDAR